ncbi:MAG TPA: hypothetical protein VGJ26_07380 [Pirellulales bacterium]|jgi:hypothetical protein
MVWSTDEIAEPERKPFWRRKRWWFAGALAVVSLAVILQVVKNRSEIARQLAAIRDRGEPTNLAELELYYKSPPPDQDVTQIWREGAVPIAAATTYQAARRIPFFGDVGAPPLLGEPWPEIERSRQLLQSNAVALQKLHDAAARGGQARYPIGLAAQLDNSQLLRNAARCLALEANVRAHDGDLSGAAESIRTGLLLSQSMAEAPTSISQLIRVSLHSMIIHELRRIGPVNLPDADLQRLQEAFSQIEFSSAVKRVAIGERAYGISMFDDPNSVGALPKHLQYASKLTHSMDLVTFLRLTTELVDLGDLSWPERTAAMDEWARRNSIRVTRLHGLSQLLAPMYPMMHTMFARSETQNRLAAVDVAIARYKQRHGRWPESLDALVPDFLAEALHEPITAAPFAYRTTDEGYLLYSPPNGRSSALLGNADPETGGDPRLVFRWPPLPDDEPETSTVEGTDEPSDSPEGEG